MSENRGYAATAEARNADLGTLVEILKTQRARATDFVAPATTLASERGLLRVSGSEPIFDEDGVTLTDGRYRFTAAAEAQLAEALKIPVAYMRRMRNEAVDLMDHNVNAWLYGDYGQGVTPRKADKRNFLVRTLARDGADDAGVVRAILSDTYKIQDNLDTLMAVLEGVKAAGVPVEIAGADLTDTRMYVRVDAPGITAEAPNLLAGYRSPFRDGGAERVFADLRARYGEHHMFDQDDAPIVSAGFIFRNSETGHGAWSITPRLTVLRCTNGLTIEKEAARSIHLGRRLEVGNIRWSDDTQKANLELIKAKTRDIVANYLSGDFLNAALNRLSVDAGAPVKDAEKTIKFVSRQLSFSEAEQATILDHFILGGQLTAGGVMQAVSSAAQTIADADAANELERQAVPAMLAAAGLN